MKIEMEWKPIKDAPKDKRLLVCYNDGSNCFESIQVYLKNFEEYIWKNDEFGRINLPDYYAEFPKTPFQITEEKSK